MLGVMRLTLEREGGSMRGEEDFFSVARTIPFVAGLSLAGSFERKVTQAYL
jgi:hypothetical protein